MRRIHALICPIFLSALLTTFSQPVLGQGVGVSLRSGVRAGTRIPVAQLVEFIAQNVMIGETEKNLTSPPASRTARTETASALIRMELITRAGVVATFESQAVRVEPGKTYDAGTWIPRPEPVNEGLSAPLKPAEFVIFRIGQKTIPSLGAHKFPGECGGASHAVLITLVTDDARRARASGALGLCLDVGR